MLYQGEAIEIEFNVSYLLDVFNVIPSNQAQMTFIDSQSSVLIESDKKWKQCMYATLNQRMIIERYVLHHFRNN